MNIMTTKPLVSVVIIGRNEGERLIRCLNSIHQINKTEFTIEIIYVDSASTDNSIQNALKYQAQIVSVNPDRPSAAIGRNAGWRVARGNFILFLDGDTILHPDFIAHALKAMQNQHIAVVWGHRRELDPDQSVYVQAMDLDWIYPAGPCEFCGGDALMRTSVLHETGGFDDSLIAGEEPELCRRVRHAGYTILHIDTPMTLHDLAITRFSAYWKRAFRAGHAYAEIATRFAESSDPLWQSEAKRNIRHGLLILSMPLLILIACYQILVWPIILTAGMAMLCRTYVRTKTKSKKTITRLIYTLHSHFQQLPIFVGQISFYLDELRGINRRLIDYKESD